MNHQDAGTGMSGAGMEGQMVRSQVLKSQAMKSYRQVDVGGMTTDASPYRLIQMLMNGAMERIHQARGCMQHGDALGRNEAIGRAVAIIGGLQESLDLDKGGELAGNLEKLYDYMMRRLFDANVRNDPVALDEVGRLMATIKDAWDKLPEVAGIS